MSSAPPNNVTQADLLDEDAMLKGRKKPPPDDAPPPPLSPSVAASLRDLPDGRPVRAGALVNVLLKRHPEYGGGLAERVKMDENAGTAPARPPDDWLRGVRALFSEPAAELHTRVAVLGLCLLDPTVGDALHAHGLFDALARELREPLDALFSRDALAWRPDAKADERHEEEEASSEPDDATPTHSDVPTAGVSQDKLGRECFAQALATRLRRLRQERPSDPFTLHIHGPWGSGKSSILNFLRSELEDTARQKRLDDELKDLGLPPQAWIVVEFNAWQHQRVAPPWWSLLTAVFHQSLDRLWDGEPGASRRERQQSRARAVRLWWRGHLWRFGMGRGPYLLVAAVVIGLGLWQAGRLNLFSQTGSLKGMAESVEAVGKVLAFGGTVWALAYGASRSLLAGTGQAADAFVAAAGRDPMRALARHFEEMVHDIGRPVAVFVDDLDRCRGDYVIELLEGIQTLFGNAPVTYVIAADRRWLCASFAKHYADYADTVTEPGRPLGYLFLEKLVQLSAPVPCLPAPLRDRYWQALIAGPDAPLGGGDGTLHGGDLDPQNLENARVAVRGLNDDELRGLAVAGTENAAPSAAHQQAAREETVKRALTPCAQKQAERLLVPFAPLLEPNPRAMKRLINAYGVQTAINTLGHGDVDRRQLALWTILLLRFPLLAERLTDEPDLVFFIAPPGDNSPPPTLPADVSDDRQLCRLFTNDDVRDVIHGRAAGRPLGAVLDADGIRACAGLHLATPKPKETAPAAAA